MASEKVTLVINSEDNASKDLKKVNSSLGSLNNSTDKASASSVKLKSALGAAAKGAALLGAAIVGVAAKGLQGAAKLEQTSVSLEVMTGSAEQARKTLAELEKFAEVTPFKTDEVLAAGKSLIAFGESTKTVTTTLQRLGDVASLTNQRSLQEMVLMFSKIRSSGTAMTEDLNQLQEAGVPALDELAKITGKTTAEVKKMASEGKISAGMIEQVFINMTKEGGKAFGMMDKQSKTLAGVYSTATSIVDKAASNMGQVLLPVAKEVLNAFIDNKKSVTEFGTAIGEVLLKAINVIIAVIKEVVSVVQGAIDIWESLGETIQTAIKIVTALGVAFAVLPVVFAAVSAFAAANPFMLIIIGVVALIAAIVKIRQNWGVVSAAIGVGIAKMQDSFAFLVATVKSYFFSLLSKLLYVYSLMFSPIIKGVNTIIEAYNKFSGKSIGYIKNVAAQGSYYANKLAEEEQKKADKISSGSKRLFEAQSKYYKAVHDSKQQNDKDDIESDKNKNKKILDSTTKTTKEVKALNKGAATDFAKQWKEKIETATKPIQDFFTQFTTGLGLVTDIVTNITDMMIEQAELMYDAQIEAVNTRLEAQIEAAGVAEETTIERLTRELAATEAELAGETDAVKRAALEQEIIEQQATLTRTKLEQEAADEIESIEEEKADVLAKIKRDQAVYEKAAAIASATVSGIQAGISALTLPPPFGQIAAGVIAALVATSIGTMIATPIPAAERGALIKGSSSGQLIRAGENNKNELIVPFENSEVMNKIGGGGGGTTINVNIQNLYGEEDIPNKVAAAFDKAIYKLKQDGNSRLF